VGNPVSVLLFGSYSEVCQVASAWAYIFTFEGAQHHLGSETLLETVDFNLCHLRGTHGFPKKIGNLGKPFSQL